MAKWQITSRESRIYIASKTKHADKWCGLRDEGYPINSTWIDEAGVGETSDFTDLWMRCIREASGADALIVYRERDEVLKGAFVEVGAALSNGVRVYAVGCGDLSWKNHPLVAECPSLDTALEWAMRDTGSSLLPSRARKGGGRG